MRYKSNTFDDVFIGFFELDVRSKSMLCACVAGCPFGVVEPYDPLVSGCFSAILAYETAQRPRFGMNAGVHAGRVYRDPSLISVCRGRGLVGSSGAEF